MSLRRSGLGRNRRAAGLDISGVDALEAQVAPVLAEDPPRLIVDIGALRFADSSAIAPRSWR